MSEKKQTRNRTSHFALCCGHKRIPESTVQARLCKERVSKEFELTVSLEVYRDSRCPSRMFQLSVVFERVVGLNRAGGEEL